MIVPSQCTIGLCNNCVTDPLGIQARKVAINNSRTDQFVGLAPCSAYEAAASYMVPQCLCCEPMHLVPQYLLSELMHLIFRMGYPVQTVCPRQERNSTNNNLQPTTKHLPSSATKQAGVLVCGTTLIAWFQCVWNASNQTTLKHGCSLHPPKGSELSCPPWPWLRGPVLVIRYVEVVVGLTLQVVVHVNYCEIFEYYCEIIIQIWRVSCS